MFIISIISIVMPITPIIDNIYALIDTIQHFTKKLHSGQKIKTLKN